MKQIIIYHAVILWALFHSVASSYAQNTEYPIAWNEGTFSIEIPNEGFSSQQIEDDISDYITTNYYSWLSLDSVESGSTSELWALWFTISNNTSSTVRYADFTPWDFRIVQAAYGSSGPTIDTPSGGIATIYPGSAVGVTVMNLTSSVRAALKRRPLSGGSWTVVDSLSLTAPSCSFQRVLQDGEYQLYPLGIGFTLTYPDLLYYTYTVSGLSSATSLDCNGELKTGYITSYTDAGGVSHSIDSAFIGQLQQLFTWYNSGNAAGWDPALQLQASLSSSYAAITAGCTPNFGVARSWNTGLRLSSSTVLSFFQADDGDLQQKTCTFAPGMAQISSSQYGVTYILSDGVHNVDYPGTGATINIYLAGSGISGAYSVYASYGGRKRLMGKRIPDNDLPPTDGTVESTGPNSISVTTVNGSPGNSVDVLYYDGLGRKKQKVAVRASGDGLKDIVTPIRLDHLGREWRSYLPFPQTGTAGAYCFEAFDDQALWWYSQGGSDQGSEYAYTTTLLEASAAGRPLTERLPGEDYHDSSHDTDFTYSAGSLPKLSVSTAGSLSVNGTYASETIMCSSVQDGDGRVTLTYTDREGRTVADGPSGALTYYAYDTCGRLAWMISPEGVSHMSGNGPWAPNSDYAGKYCYVYTYDTRGRLIEKRFPGAAVQYFVYDADDRMAFFQDGNMRTGSNWKTMFYDSCGRLVREDLRNASSSVTRASLQAAFDVSPSSVPDLYTATMGVTLLRTYVWDSYPSGMDSRLDFSANTVSPQAVLRSSPKGLQVFEDLNVLGTSQYVRRARYYDREDRVIQEVTLYPDGTVLRESTAYDIQGKPLQTKSTYTDSSATIGSSACIDNTNYYDARGRLTGQHSALAVDNQTSSSDVSFTYDGLGRLWKTVYGPGNSPAATQELYYSKQGWELTRTVTDASNSVAFSSALHYEDPLSQHGYSGVNNTVSWTGKISSWEWQQMNMPLNACVFSYDGAGRLSGSNHYSAKALDILNTEAFAYDLNTNIISHTVYDEEAEPLINSYTMVGNHRSDYDYDQNGNITCLHDLAEVSGYDYSSVITYNLLNLPHHVTTDADEYMDFRFISDGTKVSAIGYEDVGYKYAGPFRYFSDFGDVYFESCKSSGGRFWCLDSETDPDTYLLDPRTRYYIADHLGSTRAIINPAGSLIGKADYLPFGRFLYKTSVWGENNDYLWTGKEQLTPFFETDWYDSGARALFTNGLFASLDPMAEDYPGISPYTYCAGDPVNRVDPEGEDEWEINSQGKVVKQIRNTEHDTFFMVDDNGNRYFGSDGSYLSISFNNKTFSSATVDSNTAFLTKDVTAGADLFKFMSDFTDVEQGLIIGAFGAFVFNQGLKGKIGITSMARRISNNLDTSVSYLIHSHPGNSNPSVAEAEGDIYAAKKMLSYVHRYVYTPGSNSLIPYNGKGSSDPLPWKSVFPKSRFNR